MSNHIFRSRHEPIREGLSWDDKWRSQDKGLIKCWEVGRDNAKQKSDLVKSAKNGELPILPWKGGVDKAIKKKEKYGTLNYLAMWQGLRGDDLDITIGEEDKITCSRTGVTVIYTADSSKYSEP